MQALEAIDLGQLITVTGGEGSSTTVGGTVNGPGGVGGTVNYQSTTDNHKANLDFAREACSILYPNTAPFTPDPRRGTCMLDELHRLTNTTTQPQPPPR